MAVRPIRTHPDQVLRQKAKRIGCVDEAVNRLIDDMVETMVAAPGVGLAAPQVGVSQRLIVIQMPDEPVVVLINPQTIKKGGEQVCEGEGCLSIPGYRGNVRRCGWIRVRAQGKEGQTFEIKGEGLLAQVLEHEIDHLNGILYIDRLEDKESLVPVIEEKAVAVPQSEAY